MVNLHTEWWQSIRQIYEQHDSLFSDQHSNVYMIFSSNWSCAKDNDETFVLYWIISSEVSCLEITSVIWSVY